jgi:hypothetical protein
VGNLWDDWVKDYCKSLVHECETVNRPLALDRQWLGGGLPEGPCLRVRHEGSKLLIEWRPKKHCGGRLGPC